MTAINQKIVIVDDEQEILDIQQAALSEIGLSAEAFTTASPAWERIAAGDVSLVITDWNMPGMNGMVLLFKIQSLELPPCVIVMTAFDTMSHAAQARDEGAYDFLIKPVDIRRYQTVVKAALEHQRVTGNNAQLKA